MSIVSPRVRTTLRRTAFWSITAVVALLVAVVALALRGSTMPGGAYLSATNPAPGGAMAVAEVLRDQGITVRIVDTEGEASAALQRGDATLLLHDGGGYLDAEQLQSVSEQASHTVLVEPHLLQLRELAPAVSAAGAVGGELEADCSVEAVQRAGAVLGDGIGYRLTGDADQAEACLGSGDDVYSLIRFATDGRTVTVLGASAALTNERVAELGNAALALNLLGEHSTLVWYLPTLADAADENATIADLTPEWVSPVLVLLFIVVIAAGVWKGRRMGPLVVEHLPVTVPANETVDGRARLYQKASARLRALDALRVGTASRLAVACRLPRDASVTAVAAVVASITGRDVGAVTSLLLNAEPRTDSELIRMSDDLLTLEHDVAKALHGDHESSDRRGTTAPTTPDPGE